MGRSHFFKHDLVSIVIPTDAPISSWCHIYIKKKAYQKTQKSNHSIIASKPLETLVTRKCFSVDSISWRILLS